MTQDIQEETIYGVPPLLPDCCHNCQAFFMESDGTGINLTCRREVPQVIPVAWKETAPTEFKVNTWISVWPNTQVNFWCHRHIRKA